MPVRVLIVDDDAAFRESIGAVLAERGYDVVGEAGSVAEARARIAEVEPDALLLDVNLPDGNGIALAADLPMTVLLTSTDADAATPRLVERSGAAGFIAKSHLMTTDLAAYLG